MNSLFCVTELTNTFVYVQFHKKYVIKFKNVQSM